MKVKWSGQTFFVSLEATNGQKSIIGKLTQLCCFFFQFQLSFFIDLLKSYIGPRRNIIKKKQWKYL